MQKYSKIQTIYKRDNNFKVIPSIREDDTILAMSYLMNIRVEEKIDGTNAQMELIFHPSTHKEPEILFHSRSNLIKDKDIMFIRETLTKIVDFKTLKEWYYKNYCLDKEGNLREGVTSIRIYGEVFGDKIQKNSYTPKNIRDFRVFDIQIGNSWLSPIQRDILCKELKLNPVPTVTTLIQFPPYEAIYDMLHRTYNKSITAQEYGKDSELEGYILRPQITLYTNKGRVIGKIKKKDFPHE